MHLAWHMEDSEPHRTASHWVHWFGTVADWGVGMDGNQGIVHSAAAVVDGRQRQLYGSNEAEGYR